MLVAWRAMNPDDFDYELPDHLIARFPSPVRSASQLAVPEVDTTSVLDLTVDQLPSLLESGDLLVVNNTRVIPARLFGRRRTGASIEILLERQTAASDATAQLRANRKPVEHEPFDIVDDSQSVIASARIVGRDDRFFTLEFDRPIADITEQAGHMPLPPYIDRPDEVSDRDRYQTVYAERPGAVAAPTAGLHFDEALLAALHRRGVDRCSVTLHVAAGTYQPLSEQQLESGRLHKEWYSVDQDVVDAVNETRKRGGRVVAVGTTALRALESAARSGTLTAATGDTDLFIRPGFHFEVVDGLLTNFHLPRSSLMMLVAAFAGHERIMQVYRHAVMREYRFFSYGDAMLLWRQAEAR